MERSQSQRNHSQPMTAHCTQDTTSCNTQVTLLDICYHHSNSSAEFPPRTHAHTLKESWAVPLVQRRMQREKRGMRDTELRFPLQVVSHKHEGRTCRKKRLFWDGCYRNIISKGAGTCMDVSIEIPSVYLCVCMDKYHMPQNNLCSNHLSSTLFPVQSCKCCPT